MICLFSTWARLSSVQPGAASPYKCRDCAHTPKAVNGVAILTLLAPANAKSKRAVDIVCDWRFEQHDMSASTHLLLPFSAIPFPPPCVHHVPGQLHNRMGSMHLG